ncbi:MAG: hypothetical protein KME20_18520 [Kaiparowitsia implicata GSE-PSE-MK54-09C]|jgi:hypothetical protein|nr:hypothetical protein [Kaiparowitsia implicata GSE-PSE-MK54-09C]
MLPYVVCETQIRPFRFFFNGAFHTGMTFSRKLYQLQTQHGAADRLSAMQAAHELAHQERLAVVTVSQDRQSYSVWADMHSGSVESVGALMSPI